MRFTKLRLTGFKSFVDPTDLIIADGLTGVVGPNGCGKSNLLEALRWVMGENRPKAMRGAGMEDVIFAGAATRPARHFAEVTLSIDNSERLAPAGFNDQDTLDIVRRITRDIGSAFKTNGKDVRARDVQMLFADASTGSHSPALVRQGQISELINAKPKARRRILEEAAGISGLYQRRHEAELKLNATEQNLARVDDVLDHLAQQLEQLAQQAKQAARYRGLGEDLRRTEGLLLYRRWQEADEARAQAEAELKDCVLAVAQSQGIVQQAVKTRTVAEEALPKIREESAIADAVVQRLAVQRDRLKDDEARAIETIARLKAQHVQTEKDLAREAGLNADAGDTISRLEWEAAEIEKALDGHDAKVSEAATAAQIAAETLQTQEAALSAKTEDVARLSARHQSVARLLDDSRKTKAKAEQDRDAAGQAHAQAMQSQQTVSATFQVAQTTAETAQTAALAAEDALKQADEARGQAQGQEADARAAKSRAEGELNAIRSEATALAKLLARETGKGGQILDEITVAPGYEKAIGAALADDLLAPLVAADGPSGWSALPPYAQTKPLPNGATPLAAHVTAPDALHRRLSQIGLVSGDTGSSLQAALKPGQRLVSREGDLWRWDGFRAWAEDAPSAAALRLEQINKLEALKQDLQRLEAEAQGAEDAHHVLKDALDAATRTDAQARAERKRADQSLAEASRALSKAEADTTLAQGKVDSLALAVTRHQEDAEAAALRVQEAEQAARDLDDLTAARQETEHLKTQVDTARSTMMARRAALEELRRIGKSRAKRGQSIAQEIASWSHRLATAQTRAKELETQQAKTARDLAEAQEQPAQFVEQRSRVSEELTKSEARKTAATEALVQGEGRLRALTDEERHAERAASEARETRARAEARVEAARENIDTAADRIAESHQITPQQLLAQLDADPDRLPDTEALEARLARLKRQRDALGAVNLRAEEDARLVQDENDMLHRERDDLTDAIGTLRSGIASLNKEGRERLLTAFEQVNGNFALLFKHLFGGGEANLVMVESDDPLEAGLEIMCQPPGKKLSTLSLLSGGEQTLTALALIFAVFLANPAPICVLDEVDAPLDDANVTRFCDLLDEMCRRTGTRFLIITHHAITMARMDRLFGVTMAEQGVSQLVSVDLKKAETLVA